MLNLLPKGRRSLTHKTYRAQYWNWFSYQSNPTISPVFDGSDTSMSGDGAFVAHNGSVGGAGAIFLPSGNGGGCIISGPFRNMTVNLGPISPTMAGETKVADKFAWNPRCLKRDLSAYTAEKWLVPNNLLNLTTGPAARNIETFQNELQGRFPQGFLGLHAAGHSMIGGDAGDLFSSPSDPIFFLHHVTLTSTASGGHGRPCIYPRPIPWLEPLRFSTTRLAGIRPGKILFIWASQTPLSGPSLNCSTPLEDGLFVMYTVEECRSNLYNNPHRLGCNRARNAIII